MIFSHISTEVGKVTSISLARDYIESPLALYSAVCNNQTSFNSLLLESAEIDSKDNVKSLILADAAIRIECNGDQVTFDAKSNNGKQLLPYLAEYFAEHQVTSVEQTLTIRFKRNIDLIDEASRLVAENAFTALRHCVNHIQSTTDSAFAVFLGGTFAYDMVANFEQLPDVPDGQNTTPDFVFYLAETLIVIDHQAQTTELIGNVFSGPDAHANCFEVGQKLEALNKLCDNLPNYQPEKFAGSVTETVDIDDDVFCQRQLK